MDCLPLFHKLQGRAVLLVGGGDKALRKARLVLDAGAVLRVIAPQISAQLQALVAVCITRLPRQRYAGGLCFGLSGHR